MVWSGKNGNGERSVEITGINGSIREKESRKPKENLEDLVKRDLDLIGVDESMALDQGIWRKIKASPTHT